MHGSEPSTNPPFPPHRSGLFQQYRYPSTVGRSTAGQIRGDDLACVSIDRQVHFPPSPSLRRLSQVSDVNPQTLAIDQQMDRSVCGKSAEADVTELLDPPEKRGVIGDREVHLEQVSQGT